jgi:hypothetical protein
MAAPSDAVVIGIILTLVFSAAIYYIHTLLQQLEGKVNVLNTIIFELKKTNEQYMNMYEGGAGGEHYEMETAPLDTFSMMETKEVELKGVMPIASTSVPAEESLSNEGGFVVGFDTLEADMTEEVKALVSSSADAGSDAHSTLLSVNYESMTYKELKAEAKRKHIKGHSNLSKQELIDALKQLDAGAEPAGIASGSATFDGFHSIAEEEYVPNFEEVINLN